MTEEEIEKFQEYHKITVEVLLVRIANQSRDLVECKRELKIERDTMKIMRAQMDGDTATVMEKFDRLREEVRRLHDEANHWVSENNRLREALQKIGDHNKHGLLEVRDIARAALAPVEKEG